MAIKYNAIIDWPDRIQDKQRIPFTIELKNIMAGENRPILLYAWIEDIIYNNGKHIIMANGYLKNSLVRLVIKLGCDDYQTSKLTKTPIALAPRM